MEQTISYVALFAGIASIILAGIAIWLAIAFKKQSDDINRDTTEKLARIEAFATTTKEDAFAEIKRWGDYARAGGKTTEEADKAKEEELRKLREELQAETSEQVKKTLQAVESKLSSSIETSATAEIKKEFEQLKTAINQIQEKGLGEVRDLDSKRKYSVLWLITTKMQQFLLMEIAANPNVTPDQLIKAGLLTEKDIIQFFNLLWRYEVPEMISKSGNIPVIVVFRSEFKEYLKTKKL